MSEFEFNKIFAAVLLAGVIAMLSGFVAKKLVHPHELEVDAVPIEGAALDVGGASKPKGPEPIMALLAAGEDIEALVTRGQKLSKACAACHSFDKGGPDRVGPNLWNVMGGPVAGKSGFKYSDALVSKGGAWGYKEMNGFMWKPKKYVPGTKMNYVGLKKPKDRAAMAAWLNTLTDSPLSAPSAKQIAEEQAAFAPPEPPAEEAPAEPAAE